MILTVYWGRRPAYYMALRTKPSHQPFLIEQGVQWGSPSASDPRAKNAGQRATKGTMLTSQSLPPWCDCRPLGSTLASWRWQDINAGNPLWRRALFLRGGGSAQLSRKVADDTELRHSTGRDPNLQLGAYKLRMLPVRPGTWRCKQ